MRLDRANYDRQIHGPNRGDEDHSRSHDVEEEGDEHANDPLGEHADVLLLDEHVEGLLLDVHARAFLDEQYAEVHLDDRVQVLLDDNAGIVEGIRLRLRQTRNPGWFDGEGPVEIPQSPHPRHHEHAGLPSGDDAAGGVLRHLPT